MNLRLCVLSFMSAALLANCNNKSKKASTSEDTLTTKNTTQTRYTSHSVEVPVATRTTFEEKYPQSSEVTWTNYHMDIEHPIEWDWIEWPPMDSNDYVANFRVDTSDYWVWYDDSGNWVGTVSELWDYSALPAPVNQTITSEFPGYSIVSVDKENDKNRTAYEIRLEKGSDVMKALIDENGKVMKKKGVLNGEKIKVKNNPKDSL